MEAFLTDVHPVEVLRIRLQVLQFSRDSRPDRHSLVIMGQSSGNNCESDDAQMEY